MNRPTIRYQKAFRRGLAGYQIANLGIDIMRESESEMRSSLERLPRALQKGIVTGSIPLRRWRRLYYSLLDDSHASHGLARFKIIFLIGNEQTGMRRRVENARDRRRGHIDFSPLVAKHIEYLHTMICVRGSVPTGKCI